MNVVTLVPYREDHGERDRLWSYCRDRWKDEHPYWPISVGRHYGGPFNRSRAINTAAGMSQTIYGEWDVAVIIDADIICDPDTVRAGARLAHDTGQLYFGGRDRHMLSKEGTDALLAGYDGPMADLVEEVHPDETMCCAIIGRKLWDRVHGFDPFFVGYGFEDLAFQISCETFTGQPVTRLEAPVYHLYHEVSPENDKSLPAYRANQARYHRYHTAGGNTAAIEHIRAEAPR